MSLDIKSFAIGKANGGGSEPVIQSKSITENGTYTAPSGVDGYSPVTVNVEADLVDVSITSNGTYEHTGHDGYDEVVVNVPNPSTGNINITNMNSTDVTNYATAQVVDSDLVAGNIKKDVEILGVTGTYEGATPTGTISITSNGTTDVTNYASANVNVPTTAPDMYLEMEYSVVDLDVPKVRPKVLKFHGNWEKVPPYIGFQSTVSSANGNNFLTDARLEIPNTVTTIGEMAFASCTALSQPTIPSSVTTLEANAFRGCNSLSWTTLPSSIVTLGDYAFKNCIGLISTLTSLGDTVQTIGREAFSFYRYGTSNVQVTEIPASVTTIDHFAFDYWYKDTTNPVTLTFKGTPTSISSTAFSDCTALTTINVPWAEGAVANAPWGATNATINYNYSV